MQTPPSIVLASRPFDAPRRFPWGDPPDVLTLTHDHVGVEPPVWRRIQVPETYNFWDLHVALQDAMGLLDYHLHVFPVARPGAGEVERVGIPDDDPFEGDKPALPGWEIPITRHFLRPATTVQYDY